MLVGNVDWHYNTDFSAMLPGWGGSFKFETFYKLTRMMPTIGDQGSLAPHQM